MPIQGLMITVSLTICLIYLLALRSTDRRTLTDALSNTNRIPVVIYWKDEIMKKHIYWRGWRSSPLITIGKYTGWLTHGIAFGKKYGISDNTYFLGWLLINVKTKHYYDFIERVNAGTWPKGWIWIIKYGK